MSTKYLSKLLAQCKEFNQNLKTELAGDKQDLLLKSQDVCLVCRSIYAEFDGIVCETGLTDQASVSFIANLFRESSALLEIGAEHIRECFDYRISVEEKLQDIIRFSTEATRSTLEKSKNPN